MGQSMRRSLWLVLAMSIVSCGKSEPVHNDVVVFFDLTEYQYRGTTLADSTTIEDIITLLTDGWEDNNQISANLSLYRLNDSRLLDNNRKLVQLEKGESGGNPIVRKDTVEDFHDKVTEEIQNLVNDAVELSIDNQGEYGRTALVQPLCQYFNRLEGTIDSLTTNRTLMMFSDLVEISNVYRFEKVGEMAPAEIESVAEKFVQECDISESLPSLKYVIKRGENPLELSNADRRPELDRDANAEKVWRAFFDKLGFVAEASTS